MRARKWQWGGKETKGGKSGEDRRVNFSLSVLGLGENTKALKADKNFKQLLEESS